MILSAILVFSAHAAEDNVMYVQAVKTQIRAEANMSAAVVADIARGDELKVLEKKDPWLKIDFKGQQGWVSRLFVNTHKPIGNADLTKDVKTSPEKDSRRRSGSYNVVASTRALQAGNRTREGRESYQSDMQAVQQMEAFKVEDKDLVNFQKSVKLAE